MEIVITTAMLVIKVVIGLRNAETACNLVGRVVELLGQKKDD